MTIIGDLFVSVRPETSGFEKDLRAKLQGLGSPTGSTGAVGGALSKIGEGVAVGLVAAIGGSIALAAKFQSVTADIAANADISIAAAGKIGKAFLSTAGTSIFSANQLGGAYAAVAGQLGLLQGHALSAKQALDFMKVSSDLAEASGESLGTTTSSLAAVMQTFQIPLKGANKAATDLFNTSRVLNVPIDSLTSTIDRLKARLGVAAPSLTDMSTLLVDLGEHGVSGSRGLLVVNSALNTLLNSASTTSEAVGKSVASAQKTVTSTQASLLAAQQKLAATQSDLQAATKPTIAQQQELASATQAVTNAQQRLAASADPTVAQQQAVATAQQNLLNIQQRVDAQSNLSVSQQNQLQAAQEAVTAATTKHAAATAALQAAQAGLSPTLSASVQGAESLGLTVFDSAGKFVGLRDVIAQLQPKLKSMTEQQQLQALASVFGKNANKALLDTVLAGPAAFDKARAAVTKFTLQAAAAKQLDTLKHQIDVLRASFTDIGIEIGERFIPIIVRVGKALSDGIKFILDNKAALIALGVTFGAIATVTLTAFALTLKDKLVANLLRVAQAFGLAGKSAAEQTEPVTSLNEILVSLQATLERLQDSLPALDAELDATGASMEGLADATEVAGGEIAAGAEVAAEGVDAALGSTGVGLILIGLGLALTLLLTHWKTVWKAVKEVVDVVVRAFKADFDFIKRIFDDVVRFIKEAWKPILGILLAPIAPILVAWLIFPKQFKRIFDDVVGFVKKVPHEIEAAFDGANKLLFKVGKDLVDGLIKGLEVISPLYWVLHFKTQLLGFLSDAGKWLLDVGKKIIEGLIKGLVEAPLKGLDAIKNKVLGGIKSVFHIFSPSKDTEPIGAELLNGMLKGFGDKATDVSKIAKPLMNLLERAGDQLVKEAEACGMAIADAVAKGITAGSPAIKAALSKLLGGAGSSPALTGGGSTGAATGGKNGLELKKELLDVAVQQDFRLAEIQTLLNGVETITATGIATARTDAIELITLTRSAALQLDALLRRDLTSMVTELAAIAGTLRIEATTDAEEVNRKAVILQQSLEVDRLHLAEAKQQTLILRQLLEMEKQPKQITLKPSSSPNGNNGTTVSGNKIAAAVLT